MQAGAPYRDSRARGAPDVLVCAGLDPSGGAGLIADVRVISELGARPVGVVTAETVQNTTGVIDCHAGDPEVIGHQLSVLLTDVEVRAVKIGMVGSSAVARAIASALELVGAPVVWDPVLYPSRGDVRFADSLFGEAVSVLAPHLALITPNARELAFLTDLPTATLAEAERAATVLAAKLSCAVLVKAGHLADPADVAVDVLVGAGDRHELRHPRLPGGEHVHGTGCALSSAIAAHLALGHALPVACTRAADFVHARIAAPVAPGRGAAAVL